MLFRVVAPYVGAWIETSLSLISTKSPMSHPTWVRGLKRFNHDVDLKESRVAPYVGAWIETHRRY